MLGFGLRWNSHVSELSCFLPSFLGKMAVFDKMEPLSTMGWLQIVGSIKLQVSFAKEPYKRDDIL